MRCGARALHMRGHRKRQDRHRHRGGRGIGRGIAMLLGREGARVVVCDIGASLQGEGNDAGPAQQTVEAIKKAGGEAIASTLSITEPKNAETIVKQALDAFGRVDILVNNAGILRDVIFHKMSWSDWSDVISRASEWLVQHEPRGRAAFPRARLRCFCAHDLDLRACRQFWSGELHGGQARDHGPVARHRSDMARFNVRSNCIAPFAFTRMIESIPAQSEQDKKPHRGLPADDT